MKNKIIIDTDSGMDDIIAICMLISSRNILVDGIITVLGLVNPDIGMKNLKSIFKYLNININVFKGSRFQIKKSRIINKFPKKDVVNSSKLKFLDSYMIKTNRDKYKCIKFDKFIYKKIYTRNEKSIILCLGPLTNIARIIKRYGNKFTSKIDKLVIMGGAVYSSGNVTPTKLAEYNFFLDPEAANIVLQSNVSILLVSTDATKFVPATDKIKNIITKLKPITKTGKIIQKIIISNNKDFRYFYDPLAAAILLDPSIINSTTNVSLNVKSNGQSTITNKTKNIKVITGIDENKFYKLLLNKIK